MSRLLEVFQHDYPQDLTVSTINLSPSISFFIYNYLTIFKFFLYLKLHMLCAAPLYFPLQWLWSWTFQQILSLIFSLSLCLSLSIYIYIYEQETSVCICCTVAIKQKTQSLFDEFSYFFNTYSCSFKSLQKLFIQFLPLP